MSFFSRIRDMFRKKLGEVLQPAPKVVVQSKHDAPIVVAPPISERVIDKPYVDPNGPRNMEEALKGSMFDPLDVIGVKPTGVLNAEVRIWPKPHPEMGENAWGYATRCCYITNPATGKPFFDKNLLGLYVAGATQKMRPYVTSQQFAHVADMYMYSRDWMDAKELASDDKARAVWRNFRPEQ